MVLGIVYLWEKFPVEDAETANKRFIVLNNAQDHEKEIFIVVKTTSQRSFANQVHRPLAEGCHHKIAQGCYKLNAKADPIFDKDTWIQFYMKYPLTFKELNKAYKNGEVKGLGKLQNNNLKKILECILQTEDITLQEEKLFRESLASLK